jgi:hypothetical protein
MVRGPCSSQRGVHVPAFDGSPVILYKSVTIN